MITIAWHWLVYGVVILIGLLYLLFGEEKSNGNYISIPIIKPLVFIGLAVYTLIWGGIFWW